MIIIFNKAHEYVGATSSYSGMCIESDVSTGDKTLSFSYIFHDERLKAHIAASYTWQRPDTLQNKRKFCYAEKLFYTPLFTIEPECYIQYDGDEYIVKQIQGDRITCVLNLEWLWCSFYKDFVLKYDSGRIHIGSEWIYYANIRQVEPAAGPSLDLNALIRSSDGTYQTGFTKERPVSLAEGTGLDIVYAICAAYMKEPVFDTIGQKVYLKDRVGSDNGVEFRKGLNLKTMNKKVDSYDFYTVLYPVGKDGLEIVNPDIGSNDHYPLQGDEVSSDTIKSNVVVNFSYSAKSRVYYWKDENYTDATQMLEDARRLLSDMCHPIVSYDVKVRDLAEITDGFDAYAFDLGDTVMLIDAETGTYEKQRIIAMKKYPQNRDQDSMTLANTQLTFQEIQAKLAAAAKVVNSVTKNGKVMLSAIEDMTPVSGVATVPSGFTSTRNSITRQLSQINFSYSVQGRISTNTGVLIGTLPAGFRPKTQFVTYIPLSGGGNAQVIIRETGTIYIYDGSSLSTVAISASFTTDNDMPQ